MEALASVILVGVVVAARLVVGTLSVPDSPQITTRLPKPGSGRARPTRWLVYSSWGWLVGTRRIVLASAIVTVLQIILADEPALTEPWLGGK